MRVGLPAALVSLFSLAFSPVFAQDGTAPREKIAEALGWIKQPPANSVRFDYAMTARVRLLLFWAGKDDVGGGYIRRGFSKDDPRQERIDVLFGSDPAKAPRGINRWGGGTEILWHKGTPGAKEAFDEIAESAFFGFMKSSQGKSAGEMQAELNQEKSAGEHRFTGILSHVSPGHAVSLTEPLVSHTDFNLHQYEEAEPLILEKLSSPTRPIRELNDTQGCERAGEFLQSVAELIEAALQAKKTPVAVCYIYDAQVRTLTLQRAVPLQKLPVHVRGAKGETLINKTYEDLLEAEFVSETRKTGKRSEFTIAIGKNGELRGVPVQIRYQPNWWFQVVLNLRQLPGGGT
jgi:hypothetical protein